MLVVGREEDGRRRGRLGSRIGRSRGCLSTVTRKRLRSALPEFMQMRLHFWGGITLPVNGCLAFWVPGAACISDNTSSSISMQEYKCSAM